MLIMMGMICLSSLFTANCDLSNGHFFVLNYLDLLEWLKLLSNTIKSYRI